MLWTPVLKLSDFSSSKECVHTMPRTNNRYTMPNFAAPELRTGKLGENWGAVDIWSCGVVALTLLLGDAPTRNAALMTHMHEKLASIRGRISEGCYDCLFRIFKNNPADRPTVTWLLQECPWVTAVEEEQLRGHMQDLLSMYRQQSQEEFDAVVQRVSGK